MNFKKVIRRWMINGLGVILVLLLILEVSMAMVIRSYYYQQVENSLFLRVNSLSDMLDLYWENPNFDFNQNIRSFAEDFPDKEKMELQLLDVNGRILASSTGFAPENDTYPDFQAALQQGLTDKEMPKGSWTGRNSSGQKVSAVTLLLFNKEGAFCGAVRCLTAMDKVDEQITLLISVFIFFGLAVLFFVMLSSSYFVSSILRPLSQISDTAKQIAQGDYTCRIEKQFDDEIGELCDTINEMASEIADADRLQNEFIASVSHELRTPLTAIKGWSETLKSGEIQDGETLSKGLDVISSEADRLSGMVEDLLDFSRWQQDSTVSDFEKLDIFAEVEEAVFLFRERAASEEVKLICVAQEDLPPVEGDRRRLRQVFSNILDNAIKYSKKGGVVRVDAAHIADNVQVVISDDGIGISPKDLPDIKRKFYRANNYKSGSGIGLAVADEIMKAHGGSLEIESILNQGTVVTVTIPKAKK